MRLIMLVLTVLSFVSLPAAAETIIVNGVARTYLLDRPPGQMGPVPLIVALHGGRGWGSQFRSYSKLTEAANPEGIAVVYPDGLDRRWNDGRVNLRGALVHSAEDVAFLSRLVANLVRRGVADPERIVFTGISNGGMMAFRMACETRLATMGIVPVAANIPVKLNCQSARVRLLHIFGINDPLVPFTGGYVSGDPSLGAVRGTGESFAIFLGANRCTQTMREPLPNPVADGTRATLISGRRCTEATHQILVAGGGHTWPGAEPQRQVLLGRTSQDFSASTKVVRFALGQVLD